ncbi:heavy metal translocating P-type ATPase [Pleomorphovibrio marinus]|uniref:heavy metal translocating P-type ATPase n=1 Tax=Pleomorphovibrio marinus TaxID=2164132 RepID=UPI000E0A904E|nr:heavy metal translocating P-type ATPase metal-binding domain-containing protein [Pleomorphovibrio marinus]
MQKPNHISKKQSETTCYHCGEQCEEEVLYKEEKSFCCTGCKLVYEVLQQNELCQYYELAENPGTSQKVRENRSNRFDYLLDEDVVDKLVDYQDKDMAHITFSIPMIHCASCIWLLENLHRLHEGVVAGRVNFLKKSVQIKYNKGKIDLKELVQLLSHIGYEPTINLSDVDKKSPNKVDRSLIYRLAVAGFCFGNMMFFSLPEYFSEAELLGTGFKGLFNYLNVALALPVFFYSASGFHHSAFQALKQRKVNMDVPIVLGIFALFFYSLYEIFIVGQEGYLDTLGGLLFFLLIGKLYQQKTYDTLSFDRDYKAYFPVAVTRMRQKREEVIPLSKLEVGNLIKVRNAELIPADSVLVEGEAYIDYSFVTGEAVPVHKAKGSLIYAGGRQKGKPITLAVQKSPSQGYLTDLWNNEAFSKNEQHSMESLAQRISGKFTFTVLAIAFLTLGYWSFVDFSQGVQAFTAVLIITCPCALAMSTPFTLGNTLRIFGRGKFYLKNAQVIEKMVAVDTVVFDKTGTLTDIRKASISYEGSPLTVESKGAIKALVNQSTHPLSNRVNAFLGEIAIVEVEKVKEIQGKGLEGIYKSQVIKLGSLAFVKEEPSEEKDSGNLVYFAIEGELIGKFVINSGLRSDAARVLEEVGKGRQLHILSGDHNHEQKYLVQVFGPKVVMQFNQGPLQKLRYLYDLQEKGRTTLMLGDGLNDAGALKASDVGIALTDGVTHFSPASDAIMDASALSRLGAFLDFAKSSKKIIKSSFGLSFTYNAVGVFFAVQGLVSPVFCAVLMPISSVSVVVFTTLATNILAKKKGLTINQH